MNNELKAIKDFNWQEEEKLAAGITYFRLYYLIDEMSRSEFSGFKHYLQGITVRRLRRQKRISVAFVLYEASMWCGDDLYHFFEQDERFEPVVYLCFRQDDGNSSRLAREEFDRGAEEMRQRGIRVKVLNGDEAEVPAMDILLYLTPYDLALPAVFCTKNVPLSTLTAYIPYGIFLWRSPVFEPCNFPVVQTCWKMFMDSPMNLADYWEHCEAAFYQGEATGSPRCDYFYEAQPGAASVWKECQPGAVRIIYAPHWSINEQPYFATFQYNHQFLYDYACRHPETSWVVKPHPDLVFQAVAAGVFRDAAECAAYFQRWDDLPNARVVTGGHYQSLFASSDGMILDSVSFTAEYQYTHKPLLFLRRAEQRFNPLGQALLPHLYQADGRDFYGIARFIDLVLKQKQDSLREEREQFFAGALDYQRQNGQLASEAIYQSIRQALTPDA